MGADADFTLFRMDRHTVVDKARNYSHARDIAIPYDGRELKCAVTGTIVRGRAVMRDGVVDETAKAYGHLWSHGTLSYDRRARQRRLETPPVAFASPCIFQRMGESA